MTKIQDTHPDYQASESVWAMLRATDGGANAVKAAGRQYLPHPNGMPASAYGGYLQRADFEPAVQRTVSGMAGAVMQKEPEVKVPSAAGQWLEDIDLSDTPFNTFAGDVLRETLLMGRCAIVVDIADDRPVLLRYRPEDVISWSTAKLKGKQVLTRVVLREEHLNDELKPACRYRELFLDAQGWATSVVWEKASPREVVDVSQDKYVAGPPVVLTKRGEPLTFLPVVIFGSSTIGPEVQASAITELAHANIAHYQVSADYRHCLFFIGVPTIVVAGEGLAAGGQETSDSLTLGSSVIWRQVGRDRHGRGQRRAAP